jgi:hypothetical protein
MTRRGLSHDLNLQLFGGMSKASHTISRKTFDRRTDNMEETNESKIKTIPLDLLPDFFCFFRCCRLIKIVGFASTA